MPHPTLCWEYDDVYVCIKIIFCLREAVSIYFSWLLKKNNLTCFSFSYAKQQYKQQNAEQTQTHSHIPHTHTHTSSLLTHHKETTLYAGNSSIPILIFAFISLLFCFLCHVNHMRKFMQQHNTFCYS